MPVLAVHAMRPADDTIFAISSPPGRGWRAVVRLSGPGAIPMACAVLGGAAAGDLAELPGHAFREARLHPWPGGPTLPAALLVMRAPRSYTREDVAEIHTISSPPALSALSERLLEGGARLAGPGEFTRRAFCNGRIDLAQAEAVVRVIEAEDDRELRLAQRKLRGGLSRRVAELRERLADLVAEVEAGIDFVEQGIEIIGAADVARRAAELRSGIQADLGPRAAEGGDLRDSLLDACLVGEANVGKSSLFNRLVGEEAATVAPEPGTTRDYLRAELAFSGLRIRLTDPAGLRDPDDPVEEEAVRRAREMIEAADLAVVVLDGSRPTTPAEAEILALAGGRPRLVVLNKVDLPGARRTSPEGVDPGRCVVTSARTGEGLDSLTATLASLARGEVDGGAEFLLAARERGLLARCRDALAAAEAQASDDGPADLVASDLRDALDALAELAGEVTTEEILERIFSRFCIGK